MSQFVAVFLKLDANKYLDLKHGLTQASPSLKWTFNLEPHNKDLKIIKFADWAEKSMANDSTFAGNY